MADYIVPSNAEDRDLFRSLGLNEKKVKRLIRLKRNDKSSRCLGRIPIRAGENGDLRAAKRLGQILGQARRLTFLSLKVYVADGPALAEFCAELQSNRSIDHLELCLENPSVDVSSFASFLRENATAASLVLHRCSLQSAAELTNAMLERGEDTLKFLNVSKSPLGDVDLCRRLALRSLRNLHLNECGIGNSACASLANLLSDPQSKLRGLYLRNNFIDDEGLSALVDSLANKTRLRTLNLVGNSRISKDGWSMFLKLLCNSEDVEKSNHCLRNLGLGSDVTTAAVIDALGVNDANLLRASLEINGEYWLEKEKHAVIKRKMILCHARGDLNIVCGISPVDVRSLDVRVLPCIMAWFAVDSNADLIQYHDPPLPNAEVGATRLGSLYRLVRERPEVFKAMAVTAATAETPKETPVATEAMLLSDVEAEVDIGGVNEGELKDGKRRGEMGVKDGDGRLTMSNKKQRVDPPSLSMSDAPLEYRMEESDESVATEEPDELDGSNQFALLHAACGFYGRVPGVIYAHETNACGQDDDAGDAVNL